MATTSKFKCERCGYTISLSSNEKESTPSIDYRTYLCKNCRDIVCIDENRLREPEMLPECPECGFTDLVPWSPESDSCPKCGGKMVPIYDEEEEISSEK